VSNWQLHGGLGKSRIIFLMISNVLALIPIENLQNTEMFVE
jgi:hypothetical protein